MTGKFSRLVKIGVLTTGIAGRHLGTKLSGALKKQEQKEQQLQESYRKSGERIARTLADLKGPVMKFGQMASIQSGFLPTALTGPLAMLRKNAAPEPFEVVQKQIESEFDTPLDRLFSFVDPEPFAAASVGQVHRAITLDRQTVAVKVQYPDISDFVDADVSSLSMVLKTMGFASGQNIALSKVAEEFRESLDKELDYTREAINQQYLGNFHQSRHPYIVIPRVIPELSGKRVLTTTMTEGDTLEQATQYPDHIRNLIGERLLRMLYEQIFLAAMLHGDPNPSNYAFTNDGKIILYDFGCVKKFDETERSSISALLKGFLNSDPQFVIRGLEGIGAVRTNGRPLDDNFFELIFELLEEPLNPAQPFDVAKSDIHRKALGYMPKINKYRKSLTIPHKLILLQRVNLGCYGNLRKLKAQVNIRQILEETLQNVH
jgi:predicted unusual protein kinase regulating ubiquinone biosynthesis (AarF/ABC1/UbiB family)